MRLEHLFAPTQAPRRPSGRSPRSPTDGNGKRGAQQAYSDLAIETALTLRLVFPLALRQTEGFDRRRRLRHLLDPRCSRSAGGNGRGAAIEEGGGVRQGHACRSRSRCRRRPHPRGCTTAVEEGGRLPSARSGREHLLPLQAARWVPSACSRSCRTEGRGASWVQRAEQDARAWSREIRRRRPVRSTLGSGRCGLLAIRAPAPRRGPIWSYSPPLPGVKSCRPAPFWPQGVLVQPAIGVCVQPTTPWQVSAVQGLPSSQSLATLAAHMPACSQSKCPKTLPRINRPSRWSPR